FDLARADQRFDVGYAPPSCAATYQQEFEIVENGLHPWPHLFLDVTGQVTEVTAQRDDGPTHEQPRIRPIDDREAQASGEGEQGLAGSGHPHQADAANVV